MGTAVQGEVREVEGAAPVEVGGPGQEGGQIYSERAQRGGGCCSQCVCGYKPCPPDGPALFCQAQPLPSPVLPNFSPSVAAAGEVGVL